MQTLGQSSKRHLRAQSSSQIQAQQTSPGVRRAPAEREGQHTPVGKGGTGAKLHKSGQKDAYTTEQMRRGDHARDRAAIIPLSEAAGRDAAEPLSASNGHRSLLAFFRMNRLKKDPH
jgi:hypothetical protein